MVEYLIDILEKYREIPDEKIEKILYDVTTNYPKNLGDSLYDWMYLKVEILCLDYLLKQKKKLYDIEYGTDV